MKLSATMCIARHSYEESLQSLLNTNSPDEVCLAPNEGFEYVCDEADICIEVTPDQPWDAYGRHELYDAATGDWYLTLDDDDIAVEPLRPYLADCPDDVGLVFGDVVARYEGRNTIDNREVRMDNCVDFTPKSTDQWAGGYYALRAEAWADVRERMYTDYMVHGDTRLFYWLLKSGWDYKHIPKFMEITHRGDAITHWGDYTPGWETVYKHLERGDDPTQWLLMD